MKFSTFVKLLTGCVLGVLLVGSGGLWLVGSEWGRQQLERRLRARLAQRSDLVLGPLQLDFSLWRDFPYLTASLRHVQLTDTSFRRSVEVLRVGRADLRLALRPLWNGQLRVERLTLYDAEFRQLTDSAGHDWGLRGRGPRHAQPKAPPDFDLDSLIVYNLRVSDRNELHNSGFAAHVTRGQLVVRVRDGLARVRGQLAGELDYLRSSRSLLFEREPIVARVRYRYDFRRRQGTFRRTLATLNGDTISVSGTHRGAGPGEPRGTHLNLRFWGNQPLLEVLRVALPTGLERYLQGARSSSHALIQYTIRGLSGPTVRPRTVLRFTLRDAQVEWADAARRIRRWDARGVFDNGPAHASRTTYLTFDHCRIYSTAGQLDARLTVRDFTRPRLRGHVTGRTELQTVAAILVPELWRAQRGQVALDLELDGWLPGFSGRARRRPAQPYRPLRLPVAVRGTVRLEHAFFDIPSRQARMRDLNVRVELRDSLWRLENLTGHLNGMRLQANAATTNLLAYASGQHPTTRISGTFAVDELRLPELRRLLAAPPRRGEPPAVPDRLPPAVGGGPMQVADVLTLLPPGLLLNVGLRCGRLVVGNDTLRDLAATVRHDGHQVELENLRVRVWGGQLSGATCWRTDPADRQPVSLRLTAHFPTLDYQHLLTRITRPPRRPPGKAAADPTLRELLLAANGQVDATIATFQLPGRSGLQQVALHIDKTGPNFQIPELTFRTNTGGTGRIKASAVLAGIHLAKARAVVDLHYGTLDVQRFLQLLAALGTIPPPAPDRPPRDPSRRRDRTTRLPRGRANRPNRPNRPAGEASPFLDGTITGEVHVTADQMRYGVLKGTNFELRTMLEAGRAHLEECSVEAFGGKLELRGVFWTDSGASHHPLRAQMQLLNVQLPQLFGLAAPLGLDALGPANVRGTMRAEADIQTDLGATFLPRLASTRAFVHTDLRELELLDVEALVQALRMLSPRRTGHLYFEPVQADFLLDRGQLLIPELNLSSNLTDLRVTGKYGFDGRADLYVGLSPLQTLFGNNRKRVARIRSGEATQRRSRGLIYLYLHRVPGSRYKVKLFKKQDQQQQQTELLEEYQRLLRQPSSRTGLWPM